MSIVHYLWEHIGVDVPPAKVAEYWSHNRKFKVPWAENHPAGDYHIPLALYGDSCRTRQVSYQPARKVLGIFLSCPLFRPKSVRASRWLVFSIEEDQLQGDITLDRVLLYIAWALNCLFTGRWPRCDMKGTEFTHHKAERAGKWICGRPLAFALTELRGDWLWFKGLFRLRSSWKSGTNQPVCYMCPAMARGADRYYDLGEQSVLWRKEYSSAEWLLHQIPRHRASPLLMIRGFHQSMLRFCTMHVLNLGLLYGANGSSLILVCCGVFDPLCMCSFTPRAHQG